MLPNVSVASNRKKLPHYVHVSGTGCTHLVALFLLMVFIHGTHVTPSSGKVKTKRHLFSFLLLEGHVCYTMCLLLEAGTTSHSAYFAPIFWHYIS